MYRFQIRAQTQTGESIGLVGSTPELGQWDIKKCIPLHTGRDRYPLWETDGAICFQSDQPIEYKYVRFGVDGTPKWETCGNNRWVPIPDQGASPGGSTIVVDDGGFGYGQRYPFGYLVTGAIAPPLEKGETGLKIVVIGSSVSAGHKAWLLEGWAQQLAPALHRQYGHQVVNVAEVGANVSRTIARFPEVVVPEQPDVVIIALSLGNEGFAYCPPQARRALQRRFESGLQHLVKLTRALGARPILGGVYPHSDYTPEHQWLLHDTHQRMLTWGVPVLDWLAAVEDGQGRWQADLVFDPSHPNTLGHRRMYEAIDLSLFQIDQADIVAEHQRFQHPPEVPLFQDDAGFEVSVCLEADRLRIYNGSPYTYTLAPYWEELQAALRDQPKLNPGIYITEADQPGISPFLAIAADGAIATLAEIPPGAELHYTAAVHLFAPHQCNLLFYDGHLGILQRDDQHLWIINEADHPYNIQPMWSEVRSALKAVPLGVYHDPRQPDAPFRTLMIGPDGLESRVKAAPRSAMLLQYQCPLSDISRVAILPLGDRCAVRMMLYKMEYDGPAFPFDLTRTTQISDVADIITQRFYDMWNPAYLHYSEEAGRIYHSKWTGLSFAHEVEETDDPVHDMTPVYERMRTRYSARAERFWYALAHCDKVLFVRTGIADRGGVIDLVEKLEQQCQGKPFHLLLLSPQPSEPFADLPQVLHRNVFFNPDHMYEDLGHWLYCTEIMADILNSLGISSKNLFWCPPKPPRAIAQ
jgi:lysophospholipase L1-like esterase